VRGRGRKERGGEKGEKKGERGEEGNGKDVPP